jgi:hypothetical protein
MDNTVDTGNSENQEHNVGSEVEATNTNTETQDDGGKETETNTNTETEQPASEAVSNLGYDLNALKLPEGMSVSEEDKVNFAKTVEKIGFKDQDSVQKFVDWIYETSTDARENLKKAEEEKAEAAKKEWELVKSGWKDSLQGDVDFGKDYEANVKRANDTIVQFGGNELVKWLKDTDVLEHPLVMKTFARIGKEFEDAKLITGKASVESSKVKRDRYNQPMLVYKD